MRLLAHAGPPDALDLWLGLDDRDAPPDALRWTLDGAPVRPEVLRPLEAVRIGEAAPADGVPRMITGGFRIPVEGPGPFTVQVEDEADRARLVTRPVPADLPAEGEGWLNILLGSCFDRNMERAPMLASRVVQHLSEDPDLRPDLTLLMGDQVYLDVPPAEVLGRMGEPGLAGITTQFEQDYRLNWMTHLHGLLASAPFVCVPDDHEFWNNYPARVAWLPRTLSARGRGEWEQAARRCYDAFQRSVGLDDPVILELGPVSLFILDTRTHRTVARDRCAHPEHVDVLAAWADRVREAGRWGVFMTGQSLFKPAVSDLRGWLTDYELPNYGDFGRILGILRGLATPERPVLCLTGDVHYGRVIQASDDRGRPALYEIIASPLSLCSDPRSAHQPLLSTLYQRVFGDSWVGLNRPWPRHPTPAVPPGRLDLEAGSLKPALRFSQRGNQLALLGLRRGPRPGRLQWRVGYVPLVPDPARWTPTWVGPFDPVVGIDLLAPLGLSLAGTVGLNPQV